MKQGFIIILATLWAVCAQAQRRIVVIDMDTDLPVSGVSVKVDKERSVTTDHMGRVSVPVVFDSISFRHVRYEPERIALAEVPDTMYMLPVEHMLPEVNVSAASPELLAMFKGWAMAGAAIGAAEAPRGVVTFDFASVLDRRGRRDKKHLERAKKILKEWDKTPDTK